MKIRWTAEPRGLPDPQIEVNTGEVIDVADDVAASFIEQGLADKAGREK